jgi:phosphate-selective porin OprO/OprP
LFRLCSSGLLRFAILAGVVLLATSAEVEAFLPFSVDLRMPKTEVAGAVAVPDEVGSSDGGPLVFSSSDPVPVPEALPPAQPESESSWRFRWLGWEGIDFEIQERTSFKNPTVFTGEGDWADTPFMASHFSVERLTFHARVGIRADIDYTRFFKTGNSKSKTNRIQLRRFRVLTKGDFQLLIPLWYQLELGYVPGKFYIENMYFAMRNLRWIGELKFGQFVAPMGLDELTSSRWTSFMERASISEAMAPGVNLGIQAHRTFKDDGMTFTGGLFTDSVTSDTGDASQDYGRLIGRVSWITGWVDGSAEDEPEHMTHWGVSMNTVYSSSESVQYRSRPESHAADYLIDTGDMEARSANTIGIEYAKVDGNRLLQAEGFYSNVDSALDESSLDFWGGYLQGSWILTGERRKYIKEAGVFGQVVPNTPANWNNKWAGALEVSGRLSYSDLADGMIDGGRMLLAGAGLTWHAQRRIRVKANLIGGQVSRFDTRESVLIFQLRLSVDLGP